MKTVVLTLAFGMTAAAQIFTPQSSDIHGDTMSMTFGIRANATIIPVTGGAYSADRVFEGAQTLADGTHIQLESGVMHVFRDSLGRMRTERTLEVPGHDVKGPAGVEILDPVAGFAYLLDEQNSIAHRVPLRGSPNARRVPVTDRTNLFSNSVKVAASGVKSEASVEKLGTQAFEGLVANGERRTTVWPVGALKNDRPLTETTEMWVAPDLDVMMLIKEVSARGGEKVQRLIHVNRSEPDAALFQPPPGYQIVDEKDSFTLTVKWK